MENTVTHPPDDVDEEWQSLICDHCLLTALCADYQNCCPLQRIRKLEPRAQVPNAELLAALDEARKILPKRDPPLPPRPR
jgi:hypothetical protein